MKPGILQTIFAENWPGKLWTGGFVVATVTYLVVDSLPEFELFGLSVESVILVFAILFFGVIAYLVSLVLGSCFLPPFYRKIERLNGAPFEAGDLVEALKKPYRGRVGKIVCPGDERYGASIRFADLETESDLVRLDWSEFRRRPNGKQVPMGPPPPPLPLPRQAVE